MAVLTLASASTIRAQLLRQAGIEIEVAPARIDEAALRGVAEAEGAGPRDIADALAEQKALRIAHRDPRALVLGCDQILECDGASSPSPDAGGGARAARWRCAGARTGCTPPRYSTSRRSRLAPCQHPATDHA
jgi:septum formation protein